ncbi:uncharacterized protein [Cherax quadricarinatus]|uniref:uncharacterized protein isoform X2 n=1 Tax=Cherax quadricarinatus TaxID=27406 RepID=UPI00387ED731
MNYHLGSRSHRRIVNNSLSSKPGKTPVKPAHSQHHQKTDSVTTHNHLRATKSHPQHTKTSKTLHHQLSTKTAKSSHLRTHSNTHRPWLTLRPRAMFQKLRSPTEAQSFPYITDKRDEFQVKGTSMPLSSSTPVTTRKLSPLRSPHQDLVDLLSCPVCLEDYQVEGQGGREPLFLACHHSVCRVCLPKLIKVQPGKTERNNKDVGELSCPECRLVTLVPPSGLSQNFYLVSLIESGRKKPKELSRLRMWCKECDSVALETCAGHHLTHLTAVLTSALTTYTTTCARITGLLQVRARKKGEEVQEIKEALEQLDRASTSLRRRLVAHLDHATLAQATANSLLHEVEEMNRQVEYDGKLTEQPALPATSTSSLGSSAEKPSSTFTSIIRKPNSPLSEGVRSVGIGKSADVDKTRQELVASIMKSHSDTGDYIYPKLDLRSLDFISPLKNTSPTRTVPSELRLVSNKSSWTPSSSSTLRSPTAQLPQTSNDSYDHLNCEEQEMRITLLKQCVASLDVMEASVIKDSGANRNTLSHDKTDGDGLSKDALLSMFQKALDTLDDE